MKAHAQRVREETTCSQLGAMDCLRLRCGSGVDEPDDGCTWANIKDIDYGYATAQPTNGELIAAVSGTVTEWFNKALKNQRITTPNFVKHLSTCMNIKDLPQKQAMQETLQRWETSAESDSNPAEHGGSRDVFIENLHRFVEGVIRFFPSEREEVNMALLVVQKLGGNAPTEEAATLMWLYLFWETVTKEELLIFIRMVMNSWHVYVQSPLVSARRLKESAHKFTVFRTAMNHEGFQFQRATAYMCEDPQVPRPDDVPEPCASDEEDTYDGEGWPLP